MKKIFGPICPINACNSQFYGSSGYQLEYIELRLRKGVNLSSAPRLTRECIAYIVSQADKVTATITVKVHPVVFAKLSDESNTEWYQLTLDAAEKNITFTTT